MKTQGPKTLLKVNFCNLSCPTADLSGMEKKHARNFSLDVHPYMLTIRKPKVEAASTEPLPSEHNMDTVYLENTHTIVHVSGAITGKSNTIVYNTQKSRTKRFT